MSGKVLDAMTGVLFPSPINSDVLNSQKSSFWILAKCGSNAYRFESFRSVGMDAIILPVSFLISECYTLMV